MGRFPLTELLYMTLAIVAMGCRPSVPPESQDDAAEATAADSTAAEPSDVDDVAVTEAIFQVVLDMPELDGYWHVDEEPDRSPLLVVENDQTPPDLALNKFDQPVQILSAEEIGERPFFEFRSLERSGNRASVSFAYEVEGVIGTVELELREGLWLVTDRSLAEQ